MEKSDLTDHISKRFNKDIEDLRSSVLSMGGLVESQLLRAITAIVTGDSELGLKVANDDYKVNNLEVSIDEECGRILAMRAPAAGDLRLIVAIIKTITDLERIGDEAEKIGFLASRLAAMDRPSDSYRELKTLGTQRRFEFNAMEWRASILRRLSGTRSMTDDNMATEWGVRW